MNQDSGLIVRFIQAFTMVMLSATAMAQLMIPVDREVPVPQQLEFRGSWTCESGTDTASLTVGSINRRERHRPVGIGKRWTRVTDKDSGSV
jgi:hypothetical protein